MADLEGNLKPLTTVSPFKGNYSSNEGIHTQMKVYILTSVQKLSVNSILQYLIALLKALYHSTIEVLYKDKSRSHVSSQRNTQCKRNNKT